MAHICAARSRPAIQPGGIRVRSASSSDVRSAATAASVPGSTFTRWRKRSRQCQVGWIARTSSWCLGTGLSMRGETGLATPAPRGSELRYSCRGAGAAVWSLRRIFDVTRRCALVAVRRRGDAGLEAARAAACGAALGLAASDSLRGLLLELLADTPQLLSMLLTKAASGQRRPGTPIARTTTHRYGKVLGGSAIRPDSRKTATRARSDLSCSGV